MHEVDGGGKERETKRKTGEKIGKLDSDSPKIVLLSKTHDDDDVKTFFEFSENENGKTFTHLIYESATAAIFWHQNSEILLHKLHEKDFHQFSFFSFEL